MLIRFADVRIEPFRWDETVEVPAASLGREELEALGPIHWQGKVVRADPGFFLRAQLDYEQTVRCDRCLTAITERAGGEVELLLIDEPAPTADDVELAEEDLGVVYVEGEVFDTRPLLLEQLQLGIPMKPVCREDCRGLCPQCGADLNLGACDCKDEAGDPRWAALAALRGRLPGGD